MNGRRPVGRVEINKRLHSYNNKLKKLPSSIETSWYESRSGEMSPAYITAWVDRPRKGDWDVGGPLPDSQPITREDFKKRTKTIPIGENFTNAQWPYWNNAHHIIPKGALRAKILAVEGVSGLIQEALLKAKYNVNYQVNMFLLPQDLRIAAILSLARHLQLREDDADGGVAEDVMAHSEYSQMVTRELEPIINEYAKIVDKAKDEAAKQPHAVPKPEVTKKKLERLSVLMTKFILDWGHESPGQSIAKKAQEQMNREDGVA